MAHVRLPLIAPNQSMVTTWQSPLKTAIDRAARWSASRACSRRPSSAAFPSPMCRSPASQRSSSRTMIQIWPSGWRTNWLQICWDLREEFTIHPTPVADAIAEAMAGEPGSVYVLADISDSGASGTAGDGTEVLRGLLEAKAQLGRGRARSWTRGGRGLHRRRRRELRVTLTVGGKHDGLHGEPVEVTGMVRLIHEGRFPDGRRDGRGTYRQPWHVRSCWRSDGPGGIELQLTELRGHPNDLNFFRAFGIEPTERRILVLKSAAHFRAAFEPIATKVIEVDAPGISSPKLDDVRLPGASPPDLSTRSRDDLVSASLA